MSPHPTTNSIKSRFKRSPSDTRDHALHHIDQGIEILKAIDEMAFATHAQITHLFFTGKPNRYGHIRTESSAQRAAQRALNKLWKVGFLDRKPIMLTSKKTGFGYQHFVNVVTARGATELRKHFMATVEGELRWTKRGIKISNQTIEHSLAINDFYVVMKRAAEGAKIRFHEWKDDRQLTAMNNAHLLKLVSIPDAFFVLEKDGRYFAHFLEIDTGSTPVVGRFSPQGWQRKIVKYGEYFRNHYATDGFFRGYTAPIVLTVTNTERRMKHLLQTTREARGAGVYWYTTVDHISILTANDDGNSRNLTLDSSVFWEPIWQVVNDSQPRSLRDRLTRERL